MVFSVMKISLSLHPYHSLGTFELEQSMLWGELALSSTQAPEITCLCVILDGSAIVQMLNPGIAKNFIEYAKDLHPIHSLSVQICNLT